MALSSCPCKCKLVGQQHPTFLGPTCCVPLNTLSHAFCWKLLEVVPWGLRYSRLNFKQTSLNCIFLFHNNSSENTFITTVTNIVVKQPVKGLSIVCSHRVSLVIQGPQGCTHAWLRVVCPWPLLRVYFRTTTFFSGQAWVCWHLLT